MISLNYTIPIPTPTGRCWRPRVGTPGNSQRLPRSLAHVSRPGHAFIETSWSCYSWRSLGVLIFQYKTIGATVQSVPLPCAPAIIVRVLEGHTSAPLHALDERRSLPERAGAHCVSRPAAVEGAPGLWVMSAGRDIPSMRGP